MQPAPGISESLTKRRVAYAYDCQPPDTGRHFFRDAVICRATDSCSDGTTGSCSDSTSESCSDRTADSCSGSSTDCSGRGAWTGGTSLFVTADKPGCY